jgi:GAF domain-containing protein
MRGQVRSGAVGGKAVTDRTTKALVPDDLAAVAEAKEREAATREILEVISRSREDEQPVFDAILENAARLCNAPIAFLSLANEDRTQVLIPAHRGTRSEFGSLLDGFVEPITRTELVAIRPIVDGNVARETDIKDAEAYRSGDPRRIQMVDVEGARSVLGVPLISDGTPVGAIILYRREVLPFNDDDEALVKSFAAQAVIAIENVRQFRELQTRLEREAATREILQVISQSRDDRQPVFEAILEQAARLCHSPQAGLVMADEQRTNATYAAFWGTPSKHFEPGVTSWSLDSPIAITTAIREGRVVNIADTKNDERARQDHPDRQEIISKEEIRSVLAVPLMQGDVAIGCISVYHREVDPFTDEDIRLLENFAAQAVIAIENVRQFRELQTRLEREAATREILQVISQSRDDEQPVFNSILENAQRLCGAPFGNLNMVTEDGQRLEIVADGNEPFEPFRPGWSWPIDSGLLVARSVRECAVHQLEDAAADPLYTAGDTDRVMVVDAGVRTVLTVPLISKGKGIGSMGLYRRELRPFSPDEIALVQTFASQAVIAIENVRQFKALESLNAELGERVDEQVGEIERMGKLKRFLSPAVADAVVTKGEDMLSSHRALIATLFCDIRGFTAFCETAEPEETIEVLQTYHEEMGRLISAHGAGVDKRMGDGIMVILNDPLPCDDPAGDAVRLAIAMRARMEELCKTWKRLGHRLGFGVGISMGYATVGMVGSEGRYDYTANGTAVNMAARLCDAAEDGEILLSPRAATAVEDDIKTESAGELTLKGINQPVEARRVIA